MGVYVYRFKLAKEKHMQIKLGTKKHWSQVPNNTKHRQTWDMGTTKNGEKTQVPEHLKVGAPKSGK